MNEHDVIANLRRLKELNAREQDWVWDVAKQLHDAKWLTEACFAAALDARRFDADDAYCEACGAFAIYDTDHYRHEHQGYTCPLAENDNPAYVAHLILTEPDVADMTPFADERSSPAGWGYAG